MILSSKPLSPGLSLLPLLFAIAAISYAELTILIKLLLITLVIISTIFTISHHVYFKAQYLQQSKTWLLHDSQKGSKIAHLLGNSFVSQWFMVLNWRMLNQQKRTLFLCRWHYDEVTWRQYRVLLTQCQIMT